MKQGQLYGSLNILWHWLSSLVTQRVKHLPAMQEIWVWSLGGEDPLEKEMATHSSILAWKTPWTDKPGRLQSMGSQRVRHDWATSFSLFTSTFFEIGMKTDLFQSRGHCWVFQIYWHIECSSLTASSFRIWSSSGKNSITSTSFVHSNAS